MTKICGDCTVCCIAPSVEEFNKPCGAKCPNLDLALSGRSCSVYNVRPNRCRQFECWWLVSDQVMAPDNFRPDRCGIMLFVDGDYIYVWEHSIVWEGSNLQNWVIPKASDRKIVVVHSYK